MPALSLHDSPLEDHIYDRSRLKIFSLKRDLPDDVVEPIAREVLRRVIACRPQAPLPDEPDRERRASELCIALIAEDDWAAFEFIEQRRVDGASLEEVYLGDLSDAARALGRLWDDDRISFVDVTLGTSRIYAIMRAMSPRFPPPAKMSRRSAVFASVPGETHTLGIDMAADLFRHDGWEITLKTGRTHDALVAEIEALAPKLVGLSLGGAHSIDAMARLVVALRIANPGGYILVSGNGLSEMGGIIEKMDVDAVAEDVAAARTALADLWDRPESQACGMARFGAESDGIARF